MLNYHPQPSSSSEESSQRSIFAIITFTAACFTTWYMWSEDVDDVSIFYRYARNIGSGFGPVFNHGEFVEGFSSPAWTIILAIIYRTGFSPEFAAPSLNIGLALFTVFFTALLGSRLSGNWRFGWCCALYLVLMPPFAMWASSGMDTMLTVFICLATWISFLELRDNDRAVPFVLASILIPWIRPELWLCHLAFLVDLPRIRRRNTFFLAVALLGTSQLTLLIVRYWYFGSLLPNTYFAKTGGVLSTQGARGLGYLLNNISFLVLCNEIQWCIASGIAISVLWFSFKRCIRSPRSRSIAFYVALYILEVIYSGGDWMPLGRRLLPAIPALCVFFLLFLSQLSQNRTLVQVGSLVAVLLSTYQLYKCRSFLPPNWANTTEYEAAGAYIKQHAQQNDTIALMDIGLIGYRTNLRIIDLSGLITPEIARSPGGFLNKQYDPHIVLQQRPRFILLRLGYPADRNLHRASDFEKKYSFVTSWRLFSDDLLLFSRKDD